MRACVHAGLAGKESQGSIHDAVHQPAVPDITGQTPPGSTEHCAAAADLMGFCSISTPSAALATLCVGLMQPHYGYRRQEEC